MRMNMLAATATAIFAAAPALAQSDEPKPFDGVHVGGSIGYSFRGGDTGETVLFDRDLDGQFGDTVVNMGGANVFSPGFCNGRALGNNAGAGCANDRDGVDYGVRIGYDRQMGSLVLGALLEFSRPEIRDSVTAFTTTPASYVFTREIDWSLGLRVRAGHAAGNTLFYATGGVIYASVDNSFFSSNTANSFTGRGDDMEWGGSLGAGIEQKLGSRFTIGVEYLYSRLGNDDFVVRAGQGTAPANHPFVLANAAGTDFRRSRERFDWHSLRMTVGYRF